MTVLSLGNRLSEWARRAPCVFCGLPSADAHHLVTRGADRSLKLCPYNVVPLCKGHHDLAHALPATFKSMVEDKRPGIYGYVKLLGRTEWFKRDLSLVAKDIESLPPFEEFWRTEVPC